MPALHTTEHSWMTEEELISKVQADSNATPMERELTARLSDLVDHVRQSDAELEASNLALEQALEAAEGRA